MPKIVARINKKTGEMSLQMKGVSGDACLLNKDMKALREKLGLTGTPEMTSEYFQEDTTDEHQQQGGA